MEIIHLDSIFSIYQGQDAFSARFELKKPIINPKKMYFKSLEMPVNIANIRSQSSLNVLTIKLSNNAIYNIVVPANNYTAIIDILTALNLQAVAALPSNLKLTAILNTDRVRLLLVDSASLITSLQILPTNFATYILGFRNVSISNTLNIASTVDFNINVDNYIYLQIINLKTEIVENSGQFNIQFKIPLNAVSQMIYYSSDLTSMTQSVNFTGNDLITYLQINIIDRFGTPLTSTYNSDYSISLGIEF
jgi:hypothetical protein